MAGTALSRAVFLDRDGVLIEDIDHLADPEAVRLLPGAADALGTLRDAGYLLIVASNQAGVAKGLVSEEVVRAIQDRITNLLSFDLDEWYYCLHHPDATIDALRQDCPCRKPAPGMLIEAINAHHIDPARSFMLGNMWHDVLAANRAGVKAILVNSTPEKAAHDPARASATPWAIVENLPAAAAAILS